MKRKSRRELALRPEAPPDDASGFSRDNAIDKLVALFVAGELAPGNFSEIIITHEDTCRRQHRPGPCDCNPRIQIIRPWMVPRKIQ
jgi:hypothetical protein